MFAIKDVVAVDYVMTSINIFTFDDIDAIRHICTVVDKECIEHVFSSDDGITEIGISSVHTLIGKFCILTATEKKGIF